MCKPCIRVCVCARISSSSEGKAKLYRREGAGVGGVCVSLSLSLLSFGMWRFAPSFFPKRPPDHLKLSSFSLSPSSSLGIDGS